MALKKILLLSMLGLSSIALAENADIFGKETPLTQKESAAVQKAQEWLNANNYPFRTEDTITYLYGAGQPVAVCAPLQICLIRLGKGEKVSQNGIHLGDTARWQVSPAVGGQDQTHLIIKPVDVGLQTTLIVVTDRRSYSIRLVSRQTDLTPVIEFHHPNDIANEWVDYYQQIDEQKRQQQAEKQRLVAEARQRKKAAEQAAEKQRLEQEKQQLEVQLAKQRLEDERRRQWELKKAQQESEKQRLAAEAKQRQLQQQQQAEKQRLAAEARQRQLQQQQQAEKQRLAAEARQRQLPDTGHDLLALDFNYDISDCKNCRWRPVRVYNNGQQTVIQMPPDMSSSEAPALLVLGNGEEQLVNYRVKGNSYIVDQLFDAAILIAGVGRDQQRVVVSRTQSTRGI